MATTERGAVGGRIPDAGEQAVLDEQAGATSRAARGGSRLERLANAEAVVQRSRVRLLIQRVPVGAGRSDRAQRGLREDAGRHHDRQPGAVRDGGDELDERGLAGLVVEGGVLAHREVEQDDAGAGEVAADGDHLVRGLAVARALVVARAVEAEDALVAAVGREVHEPVEEDRVARMARALLAGGGEHERRLVAGAQQRLEVALVRDGALEDALAEAADRRAGVVHRTFLPFTVAAGEYRAAPGRRVRRVYRGPGRHRQAHRRAHRNSRTSSTGRRWDGRGGETGTPMGTTATSFAGASTPSSSSIAGAASTGAVIQHEP